MSLAQLPHLPSFLLLCKVSKTFIYIPSVMVLSPKAVASLSYRTCNCLIVIFSYCLLVHSNVIISIVMFSLSLPPEVPSIQSHPHIATRCYIRLWCVIKVISQHICKILKLNLFSVIDGFPTNKNGICLVQVEIWTRVLTNLKYRSWRNEHELE